MSFFLSKLLLYNCKFHSIKDEQLDAITSLILLMLTSDDATILMSDQLQADSVLENENSFLAETKKAEKDQIAHFRRLKRKRISVGF